MISDEALEALARLLRQSSEESFTGSIQINFFKGGVANIVRQDSMTVAGLIQQYK